MYSKDERKQLVKDFWGGFGDYYGMIIKAHLGRSKFMLYDTKMKGVELKFDATRDGAFVILEINHKVQEQRMKLYDHFESYKVVMEQDFPEGLIWLRDYRRESGQRVSRIYTQKLGIDIHRQDQWEEFYAFMCDGMIKLELAFGDVKEAYE